MIAKILPRRGNNFNGVVNYSERKADKGAGELIYSQGFISENRESVVDMLTYVSNQNPGVKNPIFHAAISFGADEKLETETLAKIACDYMDGMGYGKQPFVVYQHNDTDHRHVHIVSSRVDFETGKKIPDNFEKKRSMDVSNKIEQKYNLRKLERYKGKGYNNHMEGIVHALNDQIADIFAKHIPTSLKEFNSLLGESVTANPVSVPDKKTGKKSVKGVMLSVKSENGQGEGNEIVIQSSDVACLKQQGLMKRLSEGRLIAKSHQNDVRNSVFEALRQAGGSADTFARELKERNIEVIFHKNTGGIFGMSFSTTIEDGREIKYKATDVDRDLSWNKVKESLGFGDHSGSPGLDLTPILPIIGGGNDIRLMEGFYGHRVGDDEEDLRKKKRRKKKRPGGM